MDCWILLGATHLLLFEILLEATVSQQLLLFMLESRDRKLQRLAIMGDLDEFHDFF